MKYYVIKGKKVKNIIEWDGAAPFLYPFDYDLMVDEKNIDFNIYKLPAKKPVKTPLEIAQQPGIKTMFNNVNKSFEEATKKGRKNLALGLINSVQFFIPDSLKTDYNNIKAKIEKL